MSDEQTHQQPSSTEDAAEYAVVELMGHARHAGRLTEVERFGTKMGRVDIPTGGKFENGFTSVFFSGASIYRVTPWDLATVARLNPPRQDVGRLTYKPEADHDEGDTQDEMEF